MNTKQIDELVDLISNLSDEYTDKAVKSVMKRCGIIT